MRGLGLLFLDNFGSLLLGSSGGLGSASLGTSLYTRSCRLGGLGNRNRGRRCSGSCICSRLGRSCGKRSRGNRGCRGSRDCGCCRLRSNGCSGGRSGSGGCGCGGSARCSGAGRSLQRHGRRHARSNGSHRTGRSCGCQRNCGSSAGRSGGHRSTRSSGTRRHRSSRCRRSHRTRRHGSCRRGGSHRARGHRSSGSCGCYRTGSGGRNRARRSRRKRRSTHNVSKVWCRDSGFLLILHFFHAFASGKHQRAIFF